MTSSVPPTASRFRHEAMHEIWLVEATKEYSSLSFSADYVILSDELADSPIKPPS